MVIELMGLWNVAGPKNKYSFHLLSEGWRIGSDFEN